MKMYQFLRVFFSDSKDKLARFLHNLLKKHLRSWLIISVALEYSGERAKRFRIWVHRVQMKEAGGRERMLVLKRNELKVKRRLEVGGKRLGIKERV